MDDIRFDENGNIMRAEATVPKRKPFYMSATFICTVFCVVYLAVWTVYCLKTMDCWEGTYHKTAESGAEITVSVEKLPDGDYSLAIETKGLSVDGSITAVLPKDKMVGRDAEFEFPKDGAIEYVHIFMERENLMQLTYVFPYTEDIKVKRIRAVKLKQVK